MWVSLVSFRYQFVFQHFLVTLFYLKKPYIFSYLLLLRYSVFKQLVRTRFLAPFLSKHSLFSAVLPLPKKLPFFGSPILFWAELRGQTSFDAWKVNSVKRLSSRNFFLTDHRIFGSLLRFSKSSFSRIFNFTLLSSVDFFNFERSLDFSNSAAYPDTQAV